MVMEMKDLPKWFTNRLEKVIDHNNYKEDWLTVKVCEENGKWTPCDLIIREYLNNGGDSSKGFLGLTRSDCYKCYDFIKENKTTLIAKDYISKDGWNNFGIGLWSNWNF